MRQIDFEVTHDVKWIADLMARPEIIESSFPDEVPGLTEGQIGSAVGSDALDFIQIKVDGIALGFFILELKFPIMEIHTIIGKEHRGAAAFAAAREFTGWCFDHYRMCDELTTQVPPFNRSAALFAMRAGLQKSESTGEIFTKNGKSEHMNIYFLKRGA